MTTRVVIDSSVAFKWFWEEGEQGVAEAADLLDSAARDEAELLAPASLNLELANALRYSQHDVTTVLSIVESLDLVHIELYEMTPERLRAAVVLSYQHDMPVYDALFLALAEELDCPLVTADHRAFGSVESPVEIRLL